MWNRVNVDLVGPYTVRNKNKGVMQLHLMTMIDPVSGWFEVAALQGPPSSEETQRLFDSYWLSRYP